MLYWVIVSLEGVKEIFFGSNSDAVAKATSGSLYGPFSERRGAKGCVCNLESTDKTVLKIAEQVRVDLPKEKATKVEDKPVKEEKPNSGKKATK